MNWIKRLFKKQTIVTSFDARSGKTSMVSDFVETISFNDIHEAIDLIDNAIDNIDDGQGVFSATIYKNDSLDEDDLETFRNNGYTIE